MPNWISEHGRNFEVPHFIDYLVNQKVIEDLSWHNDEAPAFGLSDPNSDRRVLLWVGHPMRSRRYDEGDRFAVQEDDTIDFVSDDLEESLKHFFRAIARYQLRGRVGPKEWRPNAPSHTEEDWEEKLGELVDAYYHRRT